MLAPPLAALNPFPCTEILCARPRGRPSPRRLRGAPPGPPGPTLWFPGTARARSPGPSAETFHETTPFVDFRPPEAMAAHGLPTPLSAGKLCRQFVGSFSRVDTRKPSYNKTSLERPVERLRSPNGPAGLRVLMDWRASADRRSMTFGTEKLRAGAGNASD